MRNLIVLATAMFALAGCSSNTLGGTANNELQVQNLQKNCVASGGSYNGATDPTHFSCNHPLQTSAQSHSNSSGTDGGQVIATAPKKDSSSSHQATLPSGQQASLPRSAQEPTLADMKVGQFRFTLPWGMWADMQRRLWLNPHYPTTKDIEGTSSMMVQRTKLGYFVALDPSEKYQPESSPSYVGEEDSRWIPVRGFISGKQLHP